jgi:uncharacterized protein YbjT (DUF2867 family)
MQFHRFMEFAMSFMKLVVLGGVGYFGYRWLREWSAAPQGRQAGNRRSQPKRETRGGIPMTGGGRGVTQVTEDLTGESVPHRVGRGVVR